MITHKHYVLLQNISYTQTTHPGKIRNLFRRVVNRRACQDFQVADMPRIMKERESQWGDWKIRTAESHILTKEQEEK